MSKRRVWILIALHLVVGVLPLAAQINLVPNGPHTTAPSDVIQAFQNAANGWIAGAQMYASEIFWTLAGLDIAWFGIDCIIKYRQSMSLVAIMAANKILIIGMFLALMLNAPTWMQAIINSLAQIGRSASGVTSIAPSQILLVGLNISSTMIKDAGKSFLHLDLPAALAYFFAAAGILVSFLILTLQFVITIIETVLAIGVGYLMTALGGSRWTAPFVERYFSYSISAGFKLMAMYMFVGLGMTLTSTWDAQVAAVNITTFSVDLAWEIFSEVFLYVGVCWFVTKKVAGILGGSPSLTGSDGVGLIAAAIAGAGVAAAAATGVGAAVAGAGAAAAGTGAVASGAAGSAGVASAGGGSVAATAPVATGAAPAQPAAPMTAATSAAGRGSAPPQPAAPISGGSNGNGHGFVSTAAKGAAQTLNKLPHSGGNGATPRIDIGH